MRRSAPPAEGKQGAEPWLAVLRQAVGKQLQLLSHQFLRGVGRKLAREHHLPVVPDRSVLHASTLPLSSGNLIGYALKQNDGAKPRGAWDGGTTPGQ